MADITYCVNSKCPFKDCENHLSNIEHLPPETQISVAALDAICTKYLEFLVEETEQ